MCTCPYMHDVGLNEYMMKVFPSLDEVAFNCYVDVLSVKAYDIMNMSTKYVWGYGDSPIHCTSRLRLRSWVRSYTDLCQWSKNICKLI